MAQTPLPDASDPAVRARCVASARRPVHRAVLASLTTSTPAQRRSAEALATGVCVVTGQQAGLFGGPLYTVHKAVAAIVNARALEAETGVPCAPIFWLQDEDHDFDEIRQTVARDSQGRLHRLQIEGLPEQADWSVAHRQAGPSLPRALDQIATALQGLPHAEAVMQVLRVEPDEPVSDAFRIGIERLFAAHGLLVIDPMHPDLVEAARPLHARAIRDAGPLSQALLAHGDALGSMPVHVREHAPLSFFHPRGWKGPRHRIEPEGAGYRSCSTGEPFTAEAVAAGPHSTSALLRPVLQDWLLPTAAYVGGPGELRYLAQLPPLWSAFDLPTPLIVERAHFLLTEPDTQARLLRLGLSLEDLSLTREAVLARMKPDPGSRPDPDALQRALLGEALQALEALEPHAEALQDGLPKAVAKTRDHLQYGVQKLLKRYRRALLHQDPSRMQDLDALLAHLRPDGAPQERVLGWPDVAARLGIDPLVQRLLSEAVPFDSTLREVCL